MMNESKYWKTTEDAFEKSINSYFEDMNLIDFQNFKLFALAEKIKSQACHRPKPKMLYY